MKKSALISVFLCLFCGVTLFALPGIEDWLPTRSGEYVYYQDFTFTAETYIGFLQYDPGTYAVRYVSLERKKNQAIPVVSKDIQVFFTMKKDAANVELTGEKIVGEVTQDDVDIINYIHDLLYELNARRKKLNGSDFSQTVRSQEEYAQFGGFVLMNYEGYIPLYNLNTILNDKGDVLFQAVTMGVLSDSNDTAFADFKGFENIRFLKKPADKRVSLDANWKTTDSIVFTINDKALYMTHALEIDESQFAKTPYTLEDYFVKNFLLSSDGNYIYLPSVVITKEKGQRKPYVLITSTILRSEESKKATKTKDSFTKDFKVLVRENTDQFWLSILTMENDYYSLNKSYFDNYLKKYVLP